MMSCKKLILSEFSIRGYYRLIDVIIGYYVYHVINLHVFAVIKYCFLLYNKY